MGCNMVSYTSLYLKPLTKSEVFWILDLAVVTQLSTGSWHRADVACDKAHNNYCYDLFVFYSLSNAVGRAWVLF